MVLINGRQQQVINPFSIFARRTVVSDAPLCFRPNHTAPIAVYCAPDTPQTRATRLILDELILFFALFID